MESNQEVINDNDTIKDVVKKKNQIIDEFR